MYVVLGDVVGDRLAIIRGLIDKFVEIPVIRYVSGLDEPLQTIQLAYNQARDCKDKARKALDKIEKYTKGALATEITVGREVDELEPWQDILYCGDEDDRNDPKPCVRQHKRSSWLYRQVLFPLANFRFWYETIPAFNNPDQMQRVTIPGLFEGWLPRGVSHLDDRSFLITMQGVNANAGQPSIFVRMERKSGGGVMRIYRMFNTDGTVFSGSVRDVTVSGMDSALSGGATLINWYIWTGDDSYDTGDSQTTGETENPDGSILNKRSPPEALATTMKKKNAASNKNAEEDSHLRNNVVIAFAKEEFGFDDPNADFGPPVDVTVSQEYTVNVKPSALFFRPENSQCGGSNVNTDNLLQRLQDTFFADAEKRASENRCHTHELWIAEFQEPELLDGEGKTTFEQSQPGASCTAAKGRPTGRGKRKKSNRGSQSKPSTKSSGKGSTKRGQPSSGTPSGAGSTARDTGRKQEPAAAKDQKGSPDKTSRIRTPTFQDIPAAALNVDDGHRSDYNGQRGWAIAYKIVMPDGLFATPEEAYFKDARTLTKNPQHDRHIWIGEGVRGIAFMMQLAREYIVLSRCSLNPSYNCRVEFHRIDDLLDPPQAEPMLDVLSGRKVYNVHLDPGIESRFELQKECKATKPSSRPSKRKLLAARRHDGHEIVLGYEEEVTPAFVWGMEHILAEVRDLDDGMLAQVERHERRLADSKKCDDKGNPSCTTESGTKGKKRRKKKYKPRKKTKGPKTNKRPRTPENKENEGSKGTITSGFRIPQGATAISLHSDNNENNMMYMFESGAQLYIEHVITRGLDMEDSIHGMWTPVVATVPPDIFENEIFAIWRNQYKIAPRCLLPIGDACKGKAAEEGPSAKAKPGGRGKPERRSRKLLGDVREAAAGGRHTTPPGVVAMPASHRAMVDHISADLNREVTKGAYLAEVDADPNEWAVLPRGRYPGRKKKAGTKEIIVLDPVAMADAGLDWTNQDDINLYAKMVKSAGDDGDHDRRLQIGNGNLLRKYTDPDNCMEIDDYLIPPDNILLYGFSVEMTTGPIQVDITAGAYLEIRVGLLILLCTTDKVVTANVAPGLALKIGLDATVQVVPIAEAVLELEVTLLDISLIPEASLGVAEGGGIKVCIVLHFTLSPIAIVMKVGIGIYGCPLFCTVCFSVFGSEVCAPLPCGLTFCPRFDLTLFFWEGPVFSWEIFSWCNFPPDTTPPEIDDVSTAVKATQVDEASISMVWGGFSDKESNVHGYTVCIGTAPGAQDVASCQDYTAKDTSSVFEQVDVTEFGDAEVFASIFCKNGEGLESLYADSLWVDSTAPVLHDVAVLREADGSYVQKPNVMHGNNQSLTFQVWAEEDNPSTQIAMMEYGIGTSEDNEDDVANFTEVGQADRLEAGDIGPYTIVRSGLSLQHNVDYYIHVRLTNTAGFQTSYVSDYVISMDLTAPTLLELDNHNGRSVYHEHSLAWLPLVRGEPLVYSATYWQVMPSFEWEDPQSELFAFEGYLHVKDSPVPVAETRSSNPQASFLSFGRRLRLEHNKYYNVRIRAQNEANGWAEASSSYFLIDRTRPTTMQILDLGFIPTDAQVPPDDTEGFVEPVLLGPARVRDLDIDFVTSLDVLRVKFNAWDVESGVGRIFIGAGTSPGSAGFVPWTPLPVARARWAEVPIGNRRLVRHVRYHVSVYAVNGAGSIGLWSSSDGVMIDDTPPVCVGYRVKDGMHRVLDQDFQNDRTTIIAQWRGAFIDLESLVEEYSVAAVDDSDGSLLFGPASVGMATQLSARDLQLRHRQRFRVDVTARNRAGAEARCSTNGVLVDLTGPVPVHNPAGIVWDGNTALIGYEGEDIDYTWAQRSAFVSWTRFVDRESGINNYWVWVESPTGAHLTEQVWVHPSLTQWTMRLPTMGHGDTYRVAVKAVNRASSYSIFRSDSVSVDTTPPTLPGGVQFEVDGDLGLSPNVIASEGAQLRVISTAVDADSGIRLCRFALSTYPGGSDIVDVTTVRVGDPGLSVVESRVTQRCSPVFVNGREQDECTDNFEATTVVLDTIMNSDVPLLNGFSFYSWVVCINDAALFRRERAPNKYVVDAQPPQAGLVFDSLAGTPDADFTGTNNAVAGNWRWWRDAETRIRFFEVSLGTSPGATDVIEWRNVGSQTDVCWSLADDELLPDAVELFLNVRATDDAGHSTVGSSDGITVDLTPPVGGTIEHGLWDTGESRYTNRHDLVLMRWHGFDDPESGIVTYEYGLSSTPTGDVETGTPDIAPLVYVGLGDQAAVTHVDLEHLHVYYGAVRAMNGVGLREVVYSAGVMVDLTPPECSVHDGAIGDADMDFSTEGIARAAIECTDLESGMDLVMWGIGTVPGVLDTMDLQEVGISPVDVPAHVDAAVGSAVPVSHISELRMAEANMVALQTPLVDGVRYYISAVAWNAAGSFTWVTTDGQRHDASPPTPQLYPRDVNAAAVADGEEPRTVDIDFSQVVDAWEVYFIVIDPHTGVSHGSVALMSSDADGTEVVLDSVEADSNTTRVRRELAPGNELQDGVHYWVRVTFENSAGLVGEYDTDGWVIDRTPPLWTIEPVDGLDASADAEWQSSLSSLAACWEAVDDTTFVTRYQIAVRQHPGGEDSTGSTVEDVDTLAGFVDVPRGASEGVNGVEVHGLTCGFASGFVLENGATYQVVVRAVNPLGLAVTAVSSGVTIDATPPSITSVVLGANAENGIHTALQTTRESISVAWFGVADPDSSVDAMWLAMGTWPGDDDVIARFEIDFASAAEDGTASLSGAFSDGVAYYVTLWARQRAGLVSSASSPKLVIDASGPEFVDLVGSPFQPVYAFPFGFNTQEGYPGVVDGSSVIVPVAGFRDLHSGLPGLTAMLFAVNQSVANVDFSNGGPDQDTLLALVGSPGVDSLGSQDVDVSVVTRAAFSGLSLSDGAYLMAVVVATNGVSMELTLASPLIQIETATLTPGIVDDGWNAGEDLDFQASTTSLSATWRGFTDPNTDRIRYKACVGTAQLACDVRDWEDTDLRTELHVLQEFEVDVGATLFVTVEARNGNGVTVQAASNGILLGSSAPVIDFVRIIDSGAEDANARQHARYLPTGTFTVAWSVTTAAPITDDCTLQLGVAELEQRYASVSVAAASLSQRFSTTSLGLSEGDNLYATISCTTIFGDTGSGSSTVSTIEDSAPVAGRVMDGVSVSTGDAAFIASRTRAGVHWFGFVDHESGIASQELCLGTPLDVCSEAQLSLDAGVHTIELPSLSLVENGAYQFTVTSINNAGLSAVGVSDGFTVDATQPETAAVAVWESQHTDNGGSSDLDMTADGGFVVVGWAGFSDGDGSGIHHFEVFVGTTPGEDTWGLAVSVPVPPGQDETQSSEQLFGGLGLLVSTGDVIYATVVAEDLAGLRSTVTGDGLLVDRTAPVPASGLVLDGPSEDTGDDVDVQRSTTIRAAWDAFEDSESGVVDYAVRVVDVSSVPNETVLGWASVGTSTTFSSPGLAIAHQHTYVVQVRATNGVGARTVIESDGVDIDRTPPTAGTVGDGADSRDGDQDLIGGVAHISAFWSGFSDSESRIVKYEWCVGTAPRRGDILACRDVGLATSASVPQSDLDLEALFSRAWGRKAEAIASGFQVGDYTAMSTLNRRQRSRLPSYFSTVTAYNEVGEQNYAVSDGARLDVLPPLVGSVVDGDEPTDRDYDVQSDATTIHAAWFGFGDAQTGVDHYEVSVGTAEDPASLVEDYDVGDESTISFYSLPLVDGETYHVTVTAVDGAGQRSSNRTNGVLVDFSPPEQVEAVVRIGDDEGPGSEYVAIDEGFRFIASWRFQDDQSGITAYEWRVCPVLGLFDEASGVVCAQGWTHNADRTSVNATVDVVPGIRYDVEVRATNGVGLQTSARSESFAFDDTVPLAGDVRVVAELVDGDSATFPVLPAVSMQSGWESIMVQWDGFADSESGIVNYEVCIGTSPLHEDILPCEVVGLVNEWEVDASAATIFDPDYLASLPYDENTTLPANITIFYATVRVTNGAGLVRAESSQSVMVDTSPPVVGAVFDGTDGRDAAFVYSEVNALSGVRLCVSAEGFADEESGLSAYMLAVGTLEDPEANAALSVVVPEVQIQEGVLYENAFEILCVDELDVEHDSTVYVTVRATNGVGLVAHAVSDGVVVVREPPTGGIVAELHDVGDDIYEDDVDVFSNRSAEISVRWDRFGEGDAAPIVRYEVALCPAVLGCEHADFMSSFFADVGLATNTTTGAQGLEDGTRYHYHVRATNAANATVEVTSDGFVLASTPPLPGEVVVLSVGKALSDINPRGVDMFDDPISEDDRALALGLATEDNGIGAYHAGYAPMHVMWYGFADAAVGAVDHYEVCIGLAINDTESLLPCLDVGTDTYAVVTEDMLTYVPEVNVSAGGLALGTAVVSVNAYNAGGLYSTSFAESLMVDDTGPEYEYIFSLLDEHTGDEIDFTSDIYTYRTAWLPFADPDSGIAFYEWHLEDVDTGDVIAGPVHMGMKTEVVTNEVRMRGGHNYSSVVTAYNLAGLSSRAYSAPVTVDLTPPTGGIVIDALDTAGPDIDYGDRDIGAIELAWRDWEDEESGVDHYEWAVMAIDPRFANPFSASAPGETLRAAVQHYIDVNDIESQVPKPEYGGGRVVALHEADNGLLYSRWLRVPGDVEGEVNRTSAYRQDIPIMTGVTYVALLKIVNGAGMAYVASTDGVIFDASPPCLGQPVVGVDPSTKLKYVNTPTLEATWPAVIDPLHQRSPSFDCLESLESTEFVSINNGTRELNASAPEALDIIDVPVVPTSHFRWRLRRELPVRNATINAGINISAYSVVEDTAPVNRTVNSSDIDLSQLESDEPAFETDDNSTTTETVMDAPAGSMYASPWSACCSTYDELNPLLLREEWDWRTVRSESSFGQQLDMAKSRFVLAASADSVSVFDMLAPAALQRVITREEIADSFADAAGSVWLSAALDDVIAVVTRGGITILSPPSAHPHPAARFVDVDIDAEAEAQISEDADFDSTEINELARFAIGDVGVSLLIDGVVFVAQEFTGSIDVSGSLVAVAVVGVHGSVNARAVLVYSVVGEDVSLVAAAINADDVSFGEALAVDADAGVLAVGTPGVCRIGTPQSQDALMRNCDGSAIDDDFVVSGGHGSVGLFDVSEAVLNSGSFNLPLLDTIGGDEAAGDESRAFGASLSLEGGLLAVGDPYFNRTGAVTLLAVDDVLSGPGRVESICTRPAAVAGVGLGYSIDLSAASVEQKDTAFHPAYSRNDGVAIVAAGQPVAGLVTLLRVNATAWEVAGKVDTGDDVCTPVAWARRSPVADDATPTYGTGSSVAIGGGVLLYAAPFGATWPSGASTATSLASSVTGTGRIFGTSYCWAGDVRTPSVASQSNLPFLCLPCDADSGELSTGGVSRVCERCQDRVCPADPDATWYTATNETAPLEHGHLYHLDVEAVSRNGRTNLQTTLPFTADFTPPTVGEVRDLFVGNTSGCVWCDTDIDFNTVPADYIASEWCCGWGDVESDIVSFSVAITTDPLLETPDVMDWTDAGLAYTYNLENQVLVGGQRYYTCVVAQNGAGLWSEVACSDGFYYDVDPPVMEFVRDGLIADTDVDTQSFTNMAFARYEAHDRESGIDLFEVGFGTAPGLDDLYPFEVIGNATLMGVINDFPTENGELPKDTQLFVSVRASNWIGLWSQWAYSDGVMIGKAQAAVSATEETVMALDTMAAPVRGDGDNETDSSGPPPTTVAAAEFPPGAAPPGQSFVGGALSEEDLATGEAVDPDAVPAPAQNFRFGDYSFTLKATDDEGNVDEGFVFEEPIILSMLYNVEGLLSGDEDPDEFVPKLTIWDSQVQDWVNARDTCEEPWDEVNRPEHRYSVAVCHLTQFALFYQMRPHAFLASSEPAAVWANRTAAFGTYAPEVWLSGDFLIHAPLFRDTHTGEILPSLPISFSGEGSYDPDGTPDTHPVSYQWTAALRVPESGDDVDVSDVTEWTGATSMLATLRGTTRGSIVDVQVQVRDIDDGTHEAGIVVWFNEPPLVSNLETPVVPAGSTTAVVFGSAEDLEEGPTPVTFEVFGVAPRGTISDAAASQVSLGSPAIASNSPGSAVLSGLAEGTTVTVAISSEDSMGASATKLMTFDTNAPPVAHVAAPRGIFPPVTSFVASALGSSDIDGSVARYEWGVEILPLALDAWTNATITGNATATLHVDGVKGFSLIILTLTVWDNEGASNSVEFVSVSKAATIAVAEAKGGMSVISAPAWETQTQVMLDARKSRDTAGEIAEYHWELTATTDPRGLAAARESVVIEAAADGDGRAWLTGGYTAADYQFTLTVIDSAGVPVEDTVDVRVLAIVAASASVEEVYAGTRNVTLDSSATVWHPELDKATAVAHYGWSVIESGPGAEGFAPECDDEPWVSASAVGPSATVRGLCRIGAATVGSLEIALWDDSEASSGGVVRASATWVIRRHSAPVAAIDVVEEESMLRGPEGELLVAVGEEVMLSSERSLDPDGTLSHMSWSVVILQVEDSDTQQVDGSVTAEVVSLAPEDANNDGLAERVALTASAAGVARVSLRVRDNHDTSSVTTLNARVFSTRADAVAYNISGGSLSGQEVITPIGACEGLLCDDPAGLSLFTIGMVFLGIGVCVVVGALVYRRRQKRSGGKRKMRSAAAAKSGSTRSVGSAAPSDAWLVVESRGSGDTPKRSPVGDDVPAWDDNEDNVAAAGEADAKGDDGDALLRPGAGSFDDTASDDAVARVAGKGNADSEGEDLVASVVQQAEKLDAESKGSLSFVLKEPTPAKGGAMKLAPLAHGRDGSHDSGEGSAGGASADEGSATDADALVAKVMEDIADSSSESSGADAQMEAFLDEASAALAGEKPAEDDEEEELV